MARTGLQKGIKKADTFQYPFLIFFIGRRCRVRTCDPLVPNQMRYRAALIAESLMDLFRMVGDAGFEPATLWSQTRCATGLR